MESAPTDKDRTLIDSVRRQVEEAESRMAAKPERIGRYRILGVLGQGGMGIVYQAQQEHPQRTVALKVMRSGLVSTRMLRRFEKETTALGRLHHPGIAQIYEGGMVDCEHGLQPFFAMEYVDGLPLTDYCDVNKLSNGQRLDLLARVCDAVEHAHQNNVIHRDLKPRNILVDSTGQPKVLDFGVARLSDIDLQASTHKTDVRNLIGTLPYMSPEQIRGVPHEVDDRTDVYALGVLGYRMLTGRYPYVIPRNSIPEAVRVIQEEEPTRLRTLNRRLSGDIETILLKALEKDQQRRYSSAAELAADLRRFLNGKPIRARPVSNLYRFRKFARRNKSLVGGIAGVMIALTIGLIASVRAFHLAEQRLEDFRRLADTRNLDRYETEAQQLWPAYPQNIQAMEAWLVNAEALRPRLMEYRGRLAALHERSVEFNLMQDLDRSSLRHAEELNEVRHSLEKEKKSLASLLKTGGDHESESKVVALRSKIRQLESEETTLESLIPRKHYCIFKDPVDSLQHDVLVALYNHLEEFFNPVRGVVVNVKHRLSFARKVRYETLDRYRDAWNEAIDSIANPDRCPAYNGLHMVRQIGLIPIGQDPATGLWEFAHLQTGLKPQRTQDGRLQINNETSLVFILLPGGSFNMGATVPTLEKPLGSPNVDSYANPDEGPIRQVKLVPFFISKYEMTKSQWARSTRYDSARAPMTGDHSTGLQPAANITWDQCDAVLWHLGLSLPTEAQWEYAARAGTTTAWWTGGKRESLQGAANLADRFYQKNGGPRSMSYDLWLDDGYAETPAPIGHYRANGFGLHDVVGNVAEWCFDGFEDYSLSARKGDGKRYAGLGKEGYRVIRGGSAFHTALQARSSARRAAPPPYRAVDLGVRPIRRLDLAALE